MIAAKGSSHGTRPFPTHRVNSTGHKAATPGRMINHSATIITVASFLSLAAVDRYHGSTDLRRIIGDQMNQELRYLARVNPFRVIGTRIGNTIGGRIHGAGEQYV